MIDLLDDLNQAVAMSRVSPGTNGKDRSLPIIVGLLREEPSEEVIDAVSPWPMRNASFCLAALPMQPALSDAALNALESIDHHRASAIAIAIRGQGSAMT